MFGHTVICITYILLAIFTITGNDIGVLSMICVFLLVYENTSGPVAWTYAAETCCDVSLGVGILSLYATVFVLSLSSEPLMQSALQQYGVFFLFAAFNFFAIFFMYKYVPETKGLSDADKKRLFYPGSKFGPKLAADDNM